METMISFKVARRIWKQQLHQGEQLENDNVEKEKEEQQQKESPLFELLLRACGKAPQNEQEGTTSSHKNFLLWIPVLMLGNSHLQQLFRTNYKRLPNSKHWFTPRFELGNPLTEAIKNNRHEIVDLILAFTLQKIQTLGGSSSNNNNDNDERDDQDCYYGEDFVEKILLQKETSSSSSSSSSLAAAIWNQVNFSWNEESLDKMKTQELKNLAYDVFRSFKTMNIETCQAFFDKIAEIDQLVAERSCVVYEQDPKKRLPHLILQHTLLVKYSDSYSDTNFFIFACYSQRDPKVLKFIFDKMEELGLLKDQLQQVRGAAHYEMFNAILMCAQNGNFVALRMILSRAKKLNILNQQLTSHSQYYVTPLGYAIHKGDLHCVKLLVAHCSSENQFLELFGKQDCFGDTPVAQLRKHKKGAAHEVESLLSSKNCWKTCCEWFLEKEREEEENGKNYS